MNFREIENIENQAVSIETAATSGFHLEMLAEYLEKEKKKSGAKENPFVYFFEDVISSTISFDFKITMGEKYYKNASNDALSCLNTCTEFNKISSWAVSGWLQNALKFTDNIVLHYIQDCCKEMAKKYPNAGVEKSRYIQLSEKDGDISIAGFILINLYELRNKLEHRTITHPDGKQELISPQLNEVRRNVVKFYPDALKGILKTYKTKYPQTKE